MEIFSEFDKIINGSLILDMHYWASNAENAICDFCFTCWGFPNPLRSHFVWLRVFSKRSKALLSGIPSPYVGVIGKSRKLKKPGAGHR